MNRFLIIFIVSILLGALSGAVTSSIILNQRNSENNLIKDFYLTENAVSISPHSLRVRMDQGHDNYILVDLRSQEEYEKEHIIGAINIPVYKDKSTSDYNNKRIIEEFSKLPKEKEIIVYCYSMPCMSGRKIGKILAENDIYVKHLNIGWNEWRYYWGLWNHEYELNITNVTDYIAKGSEPGVPNLKNNTSSCAVDGGC